MAKQGELEEFRRRWERELQQQEKSDRKNGGEEDTASGRSSGTKSKPPRNENAISAEEKVEGTKADDDRLQVSGKGTAVSSPQANLGLPGSGVLYQPFVIVGNLLKEGSSRLSSKCPRTDASGDPRGQPGKRSYFEVGGNGVAVKESWASSSSSKSQRDCNVKLDQFGRAESFVDCLIADLDEINEIPFFATKLSREVAIRIFEYLDMLDLCRCAQVCKSWKSLAEDQLLWWKLCCRFNLTKSRLNTSKELSWKQFAEENIQRQKSLVTNWKGRNGKLTQLQYVQGGILCAVNSFQHIAVAGFTNGQVKMWDLVSEDECVFQPSDMGLVLDETAEEGTVANCITCISVSENVTAAGYKHGFVDIWSNAWSISPVHTLHCGRTVGLLSIAETRKQTLIAATYGPYVHLEIGNYNNEGLVFSQLEQLDMEKQVSEIKLSQPLLSGLASDCFIAIATNYIVKVHHPGKPESMTEVHNISGAPITCLDLSRDAENMVVGLSTFDEAFDSYKVKVYQVDGARLWTTLHGHTWYITCINLADSPDNFLVTGSGDRKVRMFDMRVNYPVATFAGHTQKVSTVQMDDCKIVSGGEDGLVCVWDQRMAARLWEWHNRHPVRYCHFDRYLIVGNIPEEKFPVMYDFDSIAQRRCRGSFQVYDFLSEQTVGLPDICLSTYDKPQGYDYNIRLTIPYDSI